MIQKDKIIHFIAGAVIYLIANSLMCYPIIPVTLIAILKEIYDWKVKHNRICFWDIVATVAGGIVMWTIIFIDLVVM